jgi:hypothetical protein
MKQPEYVEGREATENFEDGMKVLFKVPKVDVARPKKNRTRPKAASVRKSKRSDKD